MTTTMPRNCIVLRYRPIHVPVWFQIRMQWYRPALEREWREAMIHHLVECAAQYMFEHDDSYTWR